MPIADLPNAIPPMPNQSTPMQEPDGTMNIHWYRWFTAYRAAMNTILTALKAVP